MGMWSAFVAITLTAAAMTATGQGSALAADKPAADVNKPGETRTERDAREGAKDRRDVRPHPGGLVEANWVIGSLVHDASGKELGRIESVWVDPKDGQVKEVIVSIGAIMGVGGKDKVVAWKDLNLAWKDQKLFVTVDQAALRDAYQTKMDREDRGPAASPATSPKKR
jgi:sporulation protein YlmC with PRC-barrel domain